MYRLDDIRKISGSINGISASPKSNEPNRNHEDFARRRHKNNPLTANSMQVSTAGNIRMIGTSPILAFFQPSPTSQEPILMVR